MSLRLVPTRADHGQEYIDELFARKRETEQLEIDIRFALFFFIFNLM
jgi:hypothetical protein